MKPDLTRPVDFTTYNGTDKVCTREGWPWRGLGEIKSKIFQKAMAGAILVSGGLEEGRVWDFNGRFFASWESALDLFYALPEKIEKTFWIVVADTEISRRELGFSQMYTNRDEALLDCVPTDQIVPITLLVEE